MRSTRLSSKRVRHLSTRCRGIFRLTIGNAELEALELEDEAEPAYLADLNQAPDFIDEAPLDVPEVRARIS